MAKIKNHVIYDVQETLVRLREEYDMIGRDTILEDGKLTILALPRRRKEKRKRK